MGVEEQVKDNVLRTNGALRYGILLIVLGIILLGTLLPIFAEFENYQNLKKPLQDGGSPLADDFNLPLYLIGVSLFYILAGGLAITSYYKNNRLLGYASMALAVVSAAVGITCATILFTTLENLLNAMIGNPVENAEDFGEKEESVMDFTSAIYNECCFPVYDSLNYNFDFLQNAPVEKEGTPIDTNQKPVLQCVTGDIEATCPTQDDANAGIEKMFPDTVSDVLGNLGAALSTLCACISDQDRFDAFVASFQSEGSCDKFRNVIVKDVNDRLIPGVNFQYKVIPNALSFIGFEEIEENSPTIDEMAMVGKMLPADQIFNEPAEEIGFSCGLGYAKSIGLTMYFFVDDNTKPSTFGSFATGGVAIAATIILIGFWFCEGGQIVDTGDEYDDYKEEEKVKGKKKVKAKEDEYDEYDDDDL